MLESETFLSPGSSPFVFKTYDMICRSDIHSPDIASWDTSGDTFVVKDPVKLVQYYFHYYFDHNNFSSFSRQLNFYNFNKLHHTDNVHHVKYQRENFKKGRPDLLSHIKRSTFHNGTANRRPANEVQKLKNTIKKLEDKITQVSADFEKRLDTMLENMKTQKRKCTCLCATTTERPLKQRRIERDVSQQVVRDEKAMEEIGIYPSFDLSLWPTIPDDPLISRRLSIESSGCISRLLNYNIPDSTARDDIASTHITEDEDSFRTSSS